MILFSNNEFDNNYNSGFMDFVSNCIQHFSSKCLVSLESLKNDIDLYPDQQQLASSQNLRATKRQSHVNLINKVICRPKIKPLPGYSPQRQKSLALQIKNVQRKKKQLLDELKLVDKNLTMLLDEKQRYQHFGKSTEKADDNDFLEKNHQAVSLVRRMNRERKMMELRRNKTQERVIMQIQKSEEKAEDIRRADNLQREKKRKLITENIERRRSNLLRNPITPGKQRNNSFLTEVKEPVHINTLPKMETKRYPKTKIYKLISEESRLKKISEQLKEKNKIYNLEKRKLYNFVNRDKNREFFSEKSYVYQIKQF